MSFITHLSVQSLANRYKTNLALNFSSMNLKNQDLIHTSLDRRHQLLYNDRKIWSDHLHDWWEIFQKMPKKRPCSSWCPVSNDIWIEPLFFSYYRQYLMVLSMENAEWSLILYINGKKFPNESHFIIFGNDWPKNGW